MALSPLTTTFAPQTGGVAFGINAYGPGYIEVNGVRYDSPLLLHPDHGATSLPGARIEALKAADLEAVIRHAPEIVLIGTGGRQRFLAAHVLAPLISRRIGVECMTLAAACRTFNLLASEGRKTVAVLLFDSPEPSGPTFNTPK